MKKLIFITIAFIALTAKAQTFTSHFEDGTYCSVTIIGNDAYFHSGTTHRTYNEAEKVFRKYGFYFSGKYGSYISDGYRDSYSYILLDTVEIRYNRKYSESYKVQDTVYENGFKKLVSVTKYRYYICKTVFIGKGRVAGDIEYVINDSLYRTIVKTRNFYSGGAQYEACGHAVRISSNKACVEVKGSIEDNLLQSTEPVYDKRGIYIKDKCIKRFAFDKIYLGKHTESLKFLFDSYPAGEYITLMVDNTVQKSCRLYEVDEDTFDNCGYARTYSKDWEDK